jgi:hypothetical protein
LTGHRSIVAIGLAITAAKHGHRVLFATATDWVTRLSVAPSTFQTMATFITGVHHCPDCGLAHSGSRAFEEFTKNGTRVDWCAFQYQAVK